jgi:hypothetical protein
MVAMFLLPIFLPFLVVNAPRGRAPWLP